MIISVYEILYFLLSYESGRLNSTSMPKVPMTVMFDLLRSNHLLDLCRLIVKSNN